MKLPISTTPAPGWVGGFAQSNPAFAYPDPDLSSLRMLDNMANIDKLDRFQDVLWPEFSWQTVPGDESSRCYQMFAPDISRIGYTNQGRVYSIICPQQGAYSPSFGVLNVEVTVIGQRGWVDETAKTMAADMTVQGKVWFSPSARELGLVRLLWAALDATGLPFPDSKANAIVVQTHHRGEPDQLIFPVNTGVSSLFKNPDFALHDDQAWDVANIAVEIGGIIPHESEIVNDFNAMIMDIFNLAKGNILRQGNLLSWNVWFTAPQIVDGEEWRTHAEHWRHSIDTDHGSPDGPGSDPRYFDGSPFQPAEEIAEYEIDQIRAFLKRHHIGLFG